MFCGAKTEPRPESSDPSTVITMPAKMALIAPAMLRPATSSNFVIGVTR